MSSTPTRRVGCWHPRRAAAALVCVAAFAASAVVAVPALAADGVGDVPSVDVRPEHGDKHDPNGGQWFVLSLPPGGTGTVQAKISNPAKVPQTVSLALRDLIFADNGTPRIADAGTQQDVGAWGKPSRSSVQLAAQSNVVVPFTVTVPKDAEPGDHVGAIVGITANKQGTFRVVRQIGARFYVTVSGTAVRAFSITSVKSAKNSTWFPSMVDATVVLRNDGRTRVRPRVTVAGKAADGSRLLLSRSVETYTAAVSVPWYGGSVDLSVRAVTDDGTVRTAHKSVFIIPWGLIITVVVGLLLLFGLYRLVRWRLSRMHRLRADLERLERLVARQTSEVAPAPAALATDEEETIAALLTALKRAERSSGAPATMARLSLALHEAGGPAVPWLVQALQSANAGGSPELIDALRASDPDAVRAELDRAALPDELRAAVLASTAAPTAPPAPATPTKPRVKRPPSKSVAAPKAPAKTTAPKTAAGTKKGATATAPRPPKPRASKDELH